jgi:hypothetical protein
MRGREQFEDTLVDEKLILKRILHEERWRESNGFIWLRIVTWGDLVDVTMHLRVL